MAKRKSLLNSGKSIRRREFIKIAAAAAAAHGGAGAGADADRCRHPRQGAKPPEAFPSKSPYSPYAGRNFPTRPLFGDTHLHTSFSMDAGAFGARLGPEPMPIVSQGRRGGRFQRTASKAFPPIGFMVVADHSDNMGFFPTFCRVNPKCSLTPMGRRWYDMVQAGKGADAAVEIIVAFSQGKWPEKLLYVPGSPPTDRPGGRRSKRPTRLTIRADSPRSSDSSGRPTPAATICTATSYSARTAPRRAWSNPIRYHEAVRQRQSARSLEVDGRYGTEDRQRSARASLTTATVNGRMFPIIESFTGKQIDRAYAENRMRWEPLYEVTQIKVTARHIRFFRPTMSSRTSSFGIKGNLDLSEPKKPDMLEFEYARSALKNGLKLEQELGVNPYKFGLVGSTDAHTGLAAVEEDNFFGKTSSPEPDAERLGHPFIKAPSGAVIMGWEMTLQRLRRGLGDGKHA